MVLVDSLVNGFKEIKFLKIRHLMIQRVPGGKLNDIKRNLGDQLFEDLERTTNDVAREIARDVFTKLISVKHDIEQKLSKV